MLIKIGSYSVNITSKMIKTVLIIMFISSIIMYHIGIPCITNEGFQLIEEGMNDLEKESKKIVEKFKKSETFVMPEAKMPEGQLFIFLIINFHLIVVIILRLVQVMVVFVLLVNKKIF